VDAKSRRKTRERTIHRLGYSKKITLDAARCASGDSFEPRMKRALATLEAAKL
jgi:hypothetical protein